MSLAALYERVAALGVTHNGQAVPAYYGPTQPELLHAAQLPARVLLPADALTASAAAGGAAARLAVRFTLHDLFLYRPLAHGGGRDEFAAALHAYADAYLTACAGVVGLLRPTVTVERIALSLGPLAYPPGAPPTYAGVSAQWTVQEVR